MLVFSSLWVSPTFRSFVSVWREVSWPDSPGLNISIEFYQIISPQHQTFSSFSVSNWALTETVWLTKCLDTNQATQHPAPSWQRVKYWQVYGRGSPPFTRSDVKWNISSIFRLATKHGVLYKLSHLNYWTYRISILLKISNRQNILVITNTERKYNNMNYSAHMQACIL